MKSFVVALATLGLLAVGGCALPDLSTAPAPSGGALPPPEELEGEVAEPSAEGAAASGVVVIESIEPEPTAAVPSAVTLPEGSGWTHPDVPLTRQQADIEACYGFAASQIARETRIDEDRYDAGISDDSSDRHGLTTLTRRVDYYSEKRRRGALFDSCMRSKGYIKG